MTPMHRHRLWLIHANLVAAVIGICCLLPVSFAAARNSNVCQAATDREFYSAAGQSQATRTEAPAIPVTITLRGPATVCPTPPEATIQTERFHRGRWRAEHSPATALLTKMPRPCSTLSKSHGVCADYRVVLSPRPAGQYRLRVNTSKLGLISNAFTLQ